MKTFRSNGKLLLTGEYVVLDGAKALAIPTKYGQSLTVERNDNNNIHWKSHDELGTVWFEEKFKLHCDEIPKHTSTPLSTEVQNDNFISDRLIQILNAAKDLNPKFLISNQGYTIITRQDFNRKWGLGTSSTLINNIANWANVDAYQLLEKTFGGSGYDIACAQNNTPITYQLKNTKSPIVESVQFNPHFKDHLYFVYLNQKQNSRDGIKAYKTLNKVDDKIIGRINTLTESIITCQTLSEFDTLLEAHEALISNLIEQETIKSRLFNDFNGEIKSLGAWGGDFVLATSETDPTTYFSTKGFGTVFPYKDMALN
ncbi:GYDIA family GHMP kinase [Winogradskyella flava]|uniref:GHMP kinase n=1 Tax=Winogradskyella flava TaxID=1884876 RepID=A0A842IQF4_9FLAO|nr:GYDIA family GHMP kinase [Winogradskyella flava]MBC2844439.1 GHMP kinase [Winogradskyella flava]